MISNRSRYFESDGTVKLDTLRENIWLQYLISAEQPYWNAERIAQMSEKSRNAPLEYTLDTLDVLDTYTELDDALYALIHTVLCWSEVAKGGTVEDRKRWRSRGYALEIHNEASAKIYADHVHVRGPERDPVCILINTHGLAGQYLRGECRMQSSGALAALADQFTEERFCLLLEVLNACIIRPVGETIWDRVHDEIRTFAHRIYRGEICELEPCERLARLLPGADCADTAAFFADHVFPSFDLWYFESALLPFGATGAERFCALALERISGSDVHHLNFKPLADAMYYDYEGKKHVNTYKQRIIERWLDDPQGYRQHVQLACSQIGSSLLIGVCFTPVCEKLIEFCVEAERSGFLSYEKSITMLFQTFGFRRDAFDRLNNEEKYLATMNDTADSSKKTILDYVVGSSVLDVGSGGGVLLDELEDRFPEAEVIGTDISANVIEALNARKNALGKHWVAEIHNFVEGPFPRKVDSIVFSSILHEIYSYTDLGDGMFDIRSVEKALHNAVCSLNPGGRIIIRDGVKTPGSSLMRIQFHSDEGMDFFRQFLADFRGMDWIPPERKAVRMDASSRTVLTDINFGREFLYTYTWGRESFAHEVQECFGYYEISEFRSVLEYLGMRIVCAKSLLEPGYEKHLSPLVSLTDESGAPIPFPDSNAIVVAQYDCG